MKPLKNLNIKGPNLGPFSFFYVIVVLFNKIGYNELGKCIEVHFCL
jgi:hypothetical protein